MVPVAILREFLMPAVERRCGPPTNRQTNRTPFAGFAGALPEHFRQDEAVDTADQATRKTSKTPFAGLAGALPEHSLQDESAADVADQATRRASETPLAGFAGALP